MLWVILAQASEADKAVGLARTIAQGGMAVLCLVVAIAAVLAAVFQYRKNADLEKMYRDDLDARAKKAEADAEKRLTKQESDAEKRALEAEKVHDKMMKDAKESDVTLAAAVHALETNAETLEKVRFALDRVERKQ